MRVAIIHDSNRTDRDKYVDAIYDEYGSAVSIEPACSITWDIDSDSCAVRGCSLAHLKAVKRHIMKQDVDRLLVLEDDVERIEGVSLPDVSFPDDAAVIIVGSNTENHGEIVNDEWVRVLPPFWGSHGILYNMNVLRRTMWLANAFEALATYPTGTDRNDNIGVCYESIMCVACANTGTGIYRPNKLLYTAAEGFSERTGDVIPAMNKNTVLRKK